MEFLRAAFEHDLDIRAGQAPVIGLIVTQQDLHFGNRVHTDQHRRTTIRTNFVHGHAVEGHLVSVDSIALNSQVPKVIDASDSSRSTTPGSSYTREVIFRPRTSRLSIWLLVITP